MSNLRVKIIDMQDDNKITEPSELTVTGINDIIYQAECLINELRELLDNTSPA